MRAKWERLMAYGNLLHSTISLAKNKHNKRMHSDLQKAAPFVGGWCGALGFWSCYPKRWEMAKIKPRQNEDREERIAMEILVDAYGS